MLEKTAEVLVREHMKDGFNCCQSVLYAASQVFNIKLNEDTYGAAALFTRGMGSGCTCGSLVGMVMFSGIISEKYNLNQGEAIAQRLHTEFSRVFGSTCCRVLRKKHGFWRNIGNTGCIELTIQSVSILIKVWEEQECANFPTNIGSYSNFERGTEDC
ncbi:MAG: C-GCAxxG-C-C family protein [Dehalobacter sp.]|nr:C-GCAxxG-C-C family protein [Dehalobacter sp.]